MLYGNRIIDQIKECISLSDPCIFMLMSEISQAGWSFDLPLLQHILSQELLITGGRLTSNIMRRVKKIKNEMHKN